MVERSELGSGRKELPRGQISYKYIAPTEYGFGPRTGRTKSRERSGIRRSFLLYGPTPKRLSSPNVLLRDRGVRNEMNLKFGRAVACEGLRPLQMRCVPAAAG